MLRQKESVGNSVQPGSEDSIVLNAVKTQCKLMSAQEGTVSGIEGTEGGAADSQNNGSITPAGITSTTLTLQDRIDLNKASSYVKPDPEDLLVAAARIRCHPKFGAPRDLDHMKIELRLYLENWVVSGPIARLFECCGSLAEESVI